MGKKLIVANMEIYCRRSWSGGSPEIDRSLSLPEKRQRTQDISFCSLCPVKLLDYSLSHVTSLVGYEGITIIFFK